MIRKKHLKTIICLGIAIFLLNEVSAAKSRFENGFRGIVWGTHKDHLPDLGLSKKALKNVYKNGPSSILFMEGKGNLAMNLDDILLLSIFFHFQNQMFHGVDFIFKPKFRDRIYTIMTNETGSKGVSNSDGIRWKTGSIHILLTDRELMVSHLKNKTH